MFLPRRLNKFLREATGESAREVERLWAAGVVRVGGGHAPERASPRLPDGLERLVFEEDVVTVRGVAVQPRRDHHTLVLNKPRSVTSTVNDPEGKRDLSGYMVGMPTGAFPVGRLDRDTTGLLPFTTDGDLCTALLRPEHHTERVYWLWLDGQVDDADPRLRALTDGFRVASHHVRATRVAVHHRTPDFTELHVTLEEGRNRQIRRMCRALDLHLVHLHRMRFGPVTLDGVSQGSFRCLRAAEVEELWASAGGRGRVVNRQVVALERRARKQRELGAPHERLERWLRELDETGSRHRA